ncbi:MAG TPA: AAA family ATPase, partial [Acidothermaceae bacterium]
VDLDEALELVFEAERRLGAVQLALAVTAADRAVEILARGVVLDDEGDLLPHGPDEARRLLALQRARYAGAAAALQADDVAAALRFADAAVADDRVDETAHRLLMAAHQAAGEPARAIASYTQLRDVLDAELGVEPAPATRDLYVAILREQDARPGVAVETQHVPQGSGPRLVGRAAEVARLEAAWSAASSGSPDLVLLVGQAGIGKSRLSREAAVIATATGGTVLHARCYETERAMFLQPVIEALTPALERLSSADLQRVAGDDSATLAALVPSALGVVRTTTALRGDVDLERRRVFDAVTDTIGRLAERAPVLLVLDDLQNAGRATIELLHYMTRRLSGSRVLLLGVVRREEGHDAIDALTAVATVIEVNSLSYAAVADLAGAFGQAHLVDHILRQTGGHTLYVIETLGALASGQSGLPPSLHDAVVDRVSRLGPDVDTLLRAASVLGATLHVEHLAAILAITTPLVLDRCQRAYAAGLLVVAEREYEFANDLVREVLYESTPEPTRRAWHLHAADLLTDQPEAMAGHAAAAGDQGRAARAWLLAAHEAFRRFAAADAEALATTAIDAATLVSDLDLAARGYILRGRAREITTDFAAALSDLETAVALARESGDQRVEMIALRQLGGDVPVALRLSVAPGISHLERGLFLAEGLGDR